MTTPNQSSFEQMMSMINGYWVTQIIHAVATFSIADHIAAGRDTADLIAAAESIDPDATRRLLRACASIGLTTSEDGVHHAAGDLLSTLRKDVPGSLRGWALVQAAPGHWQPWGLFPEAVRTGKNQNTNAYGAELFDYLAQHSDQGAYFTVAMDELSAMVVNEAQRLIDTTGAKRAVDVGGASGSLVHALMARNPELHGAVLDRAHVVPDAVAAAERQGLSARFEGVTGDFFESVPTADLHLLKFILHDWDDEASVRILRNCMRSLEPGGRVVVIELVVGEPGEPGLAPLMDMNMLAVTGGRERDLVEFDRVFAAAGLRRSSLIRTESPMTIIVAVADEDR